MRSLAPGLFVAMLLAGCSLPLRGSISLALPRLLVEDRAFVEGEAARAADRAIATSEATMAADRAITMSKAASAAAERACPGREVREAEAAWRLNAFQDSLDWLGRP